MAHMYVQGMDKSFFTWKAAKLWSLSGYPTWQSHDMAPSSEVPRNGHHF